MTKISDYNVGYVVKDQFEGVTRELLRAYAKASGDTNPIHTNDVVAERAGLKGIIAHGLFSTGLITKLFEDHLEHEKSGKLIEVNIEMRGMVRCGDLIITEATVNKIEEKRVFLNIEQRTITNIDIKDKNGNTVKQFEAGERGYITEKDIERGLVKTKEIPEGILTYRERIATPGTAIIELFE